MATKNTPSATQVDVKLQRAVVPPTPDLGLWSAIRTHSKALAFGNPGNEDGSPGGAPSAIRDSSRRSWRVATSAPSFATPGPAVVPSRTWAHSPSGHGTRRSKARPDTSC